MRPILTISVRTLVTRSVAVLAWMTFAATAAAQSSDKEAAGRALFDEGMTLFAQGHYVEACSKFEASLARYAGIGTRGKLAECYEKLGRTASAWALYREAATQAAAAGQGAREQLALDRAKALEPKLARVVITTPTMDAGLVIRRNRAIVPSGELGAATPIDPGDVIIEAWAPGRKSWSTKIRATRANVTRIDVPPLEVAANSNVSTSPSTMYDHRHEDSPASAPNKTDRGSSLGTQRTVGLAVGGAGIAALLVGGYFGLSAKSTYDDAFDADCQHSDNTCTSAGQEKTDSARGKAVASTIFVGAGVALVTTGVVLFLTAPKRVSREAAVRLVPSFGVGSAGVAVSGRL